MSEPNSDPACLSRRLSMSAVLVRASHGLDRRLGSKHLAIKVTDDSLADNFCRLPGQKVADPFQDEAAVAPLTGLSWKPVNLRDC